MKDPAHCCLMLPWAWGKPTLCLLLRKIADSEDALMDSRPLGPKTGQSRCDHHRVQARAITGSLHPLKQRKEQTGSSLAGYQRWKTTDPTEDVACFLLSQASKIVASFAYGWDVFLSSHSHSSRPLRPNVHAASSRKPAWIIASDCWLLTGAMP